MRRAAATRPKKAPMKQANRSLVDIARLAIRLLPDTRLPANVLRDVTGRERLAFGKGG